MDGVIIDSERIHKKAYYKTFESIPVTVSDSLYKTLKGSSTINAFQKLIAHFELNLSPEELVAKKRSTYVKLFESDPTLQLIEGIEGLIRHCYKKRKKLILASSSAMVNINRVFDRFNLHSFFTAKISGADLISSKPHPEIFLRAAELAKTLPENCIVIEDSDNGIKASNDAGIFAVGYKNPLSSDQTFVNANLVIDNFNILKNTIL